MHIVTVALRGPESAALPADVVDILWVVASLADGVEHLHAKRRDAQGLGRLTFFIKAVTRERAAVLVRGIVSRALESSPALTGWHVVPDRL